MSISNKPSGPGAERFSRLLQQRASRKLEQGDLLLYEHALRCHCKGCGRLLDWECPKDVSYTETECCGLLYRLQPWTVRVHIEDVSSRPVLPKAPESAFADPAFELTDASLVTPRVMVISKKKGSSEKTPRRCGVCRERGHTRKTCPDR